MEDITHIMKEGVASNGHELEWYVKIAEQYLCVDSHTAEEDELFAKFLAHAYMRHHSKFIQLATKVIKPDFDLWHKVYENIHERLFLGEFLFRLVQEYHQNVFGLPFDLRWYDCLVKDYDRYTFSFNDKETIFRIFRDVYYENDDNEFCQEIVYIAQRWSKKSEYDLIDFYGEEVFHDMGDDDSNLINEKERKFILDLGYEDEYHNWIERNEYTYYSPYYSDDRDYLESLGIDDDRVIEQKMRLEMQENQQQKVCDVSKYKNAKISEKTTEEKPCDNIDNRITEQQIPQKIQEYQQPDECEDEQPKIKEELIKSPDIESNEAEQYDKGDSPEAINQDSNSSSKAFNCLIYAVCTILFIGIVLAFVMKTNTMF